MALIVGLGSLNRCAGGLACVLHSSVVTTTGDDLSEIERRVYITRRVCTKLSMKMSREKGA